MTRDEMKAMEGTEFTFMFRSRRTVRAYVKKVVPERGAMSCWTLDLKTDCGFPIDPWSQEDVEAGGVCVIGFEEEPQKLEEDLRRIQRGTFDSMEGVSKDALVSFAGCPL